MLTAKEVETDKERKMKDDPTINGFPMIGRHRGRLFRVVVGQSKWKKMCSYIIDNLACLFSCVLC